MRGLAKAPQPGSCRAGLLADSHLVTAARAAHGACACSACGTVPANVRQWELLPSRPRPCAEWSGVSPVPKKKGDRPVFPFVMP